MLAAADAEVDEIRAEYNEGFLSESERYQAVLKVWDKCTRDVATALQQGLDRYNPIFMMADSGAPRQHLQPEPAGRHARKHFQHLRQDH